MDVTVCTVKPRIELKPGPIHRRGYKPGQS